MKMLEHIHLALNRTHNPPSPVSQIDSAPVSGPAGDFPDWTWGRMILGGRRTGGQTSDTWGWEPFTPRGQVSSIHLQLVSNLPPVSAASLDNCHLPGVCANSPSQLAGPLAALVQHGEFHHFDNSISRCVPVQKKFYSTKPASCPARSITYDLFGISVFKFKFKLKFNCALCTKSCCTNILMSN